jgi:V/A-type H+-transporting ATPase subunit K
MIHGSLLSKAFMLLMCAAVAWLGMSTMAAPTDPEPAQPAVTAPAARTAADAMGMKYLSAALAVGLGSIAAGISVAMVGSAAMGAVAERPELMGRSLIYVGLAEGIAIYGVVVAIMILLG